METKVLNIQVSNIMNLQNNIENKEVSNNLTHRVFKIVSDGVYTRVWPINSIITNLTRDLVRGKNGQI